jgi:MFS family permease
MRLPPHVSKPHTKRILTELKEGLVYIRQTPTILFVLLMLGLISLFVLPFSTLIPVYAKDIFHGTASTFGVIDSAIGLGAFTGAIFLASLRPGANLSLILAANTFIFGVGLIAFSHTTYYPLALVFVTISAFGMMSQITITNMLIQTAVDPAMRGRVISFYAMAFFGMQPLGGLVVGSISQHIGVENTVLGEGFIAILIGMLHVFFLRRNRMKQHDSPSLEKPKIEVAIQA